MRILDEKRCKYNQTLKITFLNLTSSNPTSFNKFFINNIIRYFKV